MAPGKAPTTGQKRASARHAKADTPATKKLKASTPIERSPAPSVPIAEVRAPRLPAKIVESRPLPWVEEAQSPALSNDEYQSLAASGVLQAAMDRSRAKWTNNGIFQRYWVKPETGKHARPPPPGNPETNWMKGKGQCRIRIEPHIFEAELYVEERFKPMPTPKQYVPPKAAFSQPYRPPNATQPFIHQNQNRGLPLQNHNSQPGTPAPRAPQQPVNVRPTPVPQDKKVQPDPVISLLAARASSDQSLKTLMKEVATGNASQEQLRVFQRHIDELTKIIQDDKRKKEAEEKAAQAASAANSSTAPSMTTTPIQPQHQQPMPPPRPYVAPQPPVLPYNQQKYTPPQPPPPPASLPVVLGFITLGSTDDRFLFPQYSVLEALSPQHLLVSFIVTRDGKDAADFTGIDRQKTYWSPVTMMVEVAYGREELLNHIRRWVKTPEEVTKHMVEIMGRCTRAPEAHLAFRLPFKGSAMAESEAVSRDETPTTADEKNKEKKRKSGVIFVKKPLPKDAPPKSNTDAINPPATEGQASSTSQATDTAVKAADPAPTTVAGDTSAPLTTETTKKAAEAEGGRPKRSTRKSVRIST
ncbi:Hypothetical protein R9X50_00029500 [Acrodontium crateriforme]|uniref:SWR1-complex protein 3 domain-containing protein n=1 Tax=Acrodontium crateriforme TaxID=150365 RepID=A0AAQ3LX58_9PEZI|nr:Hypothetical protein R9X50_00029500 [Acrodontium crateriforme]